MNPPVKGFGQREDVMAPARGLFVGVAFGLAIWLIIGFIWWLI